MMKPVDKLKEAKKVENNKRDEARRLLEDVQIIIETGHGDPELAARLRMAESDIKLGRTSILEDIISKLEDEGSQNLEGVDSALSAADEYFDDPTDLTEHDPNE